MKKAQEELTFVFGLILIAALLTVSFIVFNILGQNKVKDKITALENNEININLLNYLRTIDKKTNLTMNDLILQSYYNNNFDYVTELTKDILNSYHDKDNCEEILINAFTTKDSKKLFQWISLGNSKSTTTEDKFFLEASSITLPTFDSNNDIKVTYVEGCKHE